MPIPRNSPKEPLCLSDRNVSGQYEYIARHRESVMFYVPAVLPELKMQIAHVLYFHITYFYLLVQPVFGLSSLPAQMRPE